MSRISKTAICHGAEASEEIISINEQLNLCPNAMKSSRYSSRELINNCFQNALIYSIHQTAVIG